MGQYKRIYPESLEEENDGPIKLVRLSDAERNLGGGFRLGSFMIIVEKDYLDKLQPSTIPAIGQDSAMEATIDS